MRCLMILLFLAAVAGPVAADEVPPRLRMLQGDDASKAIELAKRSNQLAREEKYAEAIAAAEELLALRRRVQGADHWEAVDARRVVEDLRQSQAMSAEDRAALRKAQQLHQQAQNLFRQGRAEQ